VEPTAEEAKRVLATLEEMMRVGTFTPVQEARIKADQQRLSAYLFDIIGRAVDSVIP